MSGEKPNWVAPVANFLTKMEFFKSPFWYERVMMGMEKTGGKFVNYGYLPQPEEDLNFQLNPEDEPNRLFLNLVEQVIGNLDLSEKRILILGSGRGGNADYIARYKNPREIIAVDRSERAISFSSGEYSDECLAFINSSIEDLDINNLGKFDIVLSIESSHCFDQNIFLEKTKELLGQDGRFILADFRSIHQIEALVSGIQERDMQIIKQKDITQNILLAMENQTEERMRQIKEVMPSFLHGVVGEFVGIKNSGIYTKFKNRSFEYFILNIENH